MQLTENTGSVMIRRNAHMRSLFITYPRAEETAVEASLFDLNHEDTRFNLQVLTADANGIAVRLPASVRGMYDLNIQDGKHRIRKRIGLQ